MANWEELERRCLSCQKCALADTRTNVVFGKGPRDAKILFIGEGPGENEDLQGEPFVGRGGQLLDEMLGLVGLSREKNFYITNIVKCRPPKNRDPLNTEQDACIGYLWEQMELIQPKIVVCLGRIAAMRLIKPDYRITKEHGQWVEKDGVLYTAIYHPAALLRDPTKKPDTFADLRGIRAKIRELCPLNCVSAFGENFVRFLASPLPTKPEDGFAGAPLGEAKSAQLRFRLWRKLRSLPCFASPHKAGGRLCGGPVRDSAPLTMAPRRPAGSSPRSQRRCAPPARRR